MITSRLWDFYFVTGTKFTTIIGAYTPTMTHTDETKYKFYEDFEYVISAVPAADKLIILGNSNARVGQDSASWEEVVGKHSTRKCNSISLLHLQTNTKHNLLITKNVSHLSIHYRISWMHPRSKHWHLIDYIIVRQRDKWDVRVTRTVCSASYRFDHRIIIYKLNIQSKTDHRVKNHQNDWTSRS